jgi:predicted phosphodiesterase
MVTQATIAIKPYINENSFTIVAMSDTHFTDRPDTHGSNDTRTMQYHRVRSLRTIALAARAARILNADAVLHGGDIITENTLPIEGERSPSGVLDYIASLIDAPFLPTLGNHDFDNRTTIPEMIFSKWWYENCFSKISDAVTVKDKGYYYLDFPQKKVRVVVLNWGCDQMVTETQREMCFSGEQLQWLGDVALDFSAKENDYLWNVIVLSHNFSRITNASGSTFSIASSRNVRQAQDLLDAWQTKGQVNIGIGEGYEDSYGPFNGTTGFPTQEYIDRWAYRYQKDFSGRTGGTILTVIQGHDHNDWSMMPDKDKSNNQPRRRYAMVNSMTSVPILSVGCGIMFEEGYASIITFDFDENVVTIRGICDPNDTRRDRQSFDCPPSQPLPLDNHEWFYENRSMLIPLRQQAILRSGGDKAEAPVADPPPGLYLPSTEVVLATETPSAIIRYTTDGSMPSINSTTYTSPITLPNTGYQTIAAKARVPGGLPSTTSMFHYKVSDEKFKFTIDTQQTNSATVTQETTFIIPTNGGSGAATSYHWDIDWGDGNPIETVQGNGGTIANGGGNGIEHVYEEPGRYTITIRPSRQLKNIRGWFLSWGFVSSDSTVTPPYNALANRNKIVCFESKLTTAMFGNLRADGVLAPVSGSTPGMGACLAAQCNGIGFTMGDDFGFEQEWDDVVFIDST